MRALIAGEKSGIIRDEFEKKGWDSWSCDLQPTEMPGKHYQGNALDLLSGKWDLLIAHPPCQFLSYAGNRWAEDPKRKMPTEDSLLLFRRFTDCNIPLKCVENPVGLPGNRYRKPTQIIHPYYFGDRQLKRTCLWLFGLPKLYHFPKPTFWSKQTHTEKPEPYYKRKSDGKAIHFTEAVHGEAARSQTFPGIARAMADQWTEFFLRQ
jgi:hypothetical protein